ncbi:hypothetical protein D3C86_839570 [compost metagenome]
MQVAAVEPQRFLLRGLPHVALFAFPGTRVLGGGGTQPPALADLVRDLRADQVGCPAVHRAVPGGVDDQVGGQRDPVGEHHGILRQAADVGARLQLDAAVDDEIASAHVDVVAGPAAQVLHEQARAVVAPVQHEARGFQFLVELGVALAHLIVEGHLELGQDLVGDGREGQVGLARGHAVGQRLFGIQSAQADVHQGLGTDNMRGRALHHRDVGAAFPQRRADVVGRVVGADDDDVLAAVGVGPGMLRRVLLLPLEFILARKARHVRLARHAGGQHQLLGTQHHGLALAHHGDLPFLLLLVIARRFAGGRGPVIQLHHLGVHLQPVADLVLGREDGPVLGEGDVRQVVVPDRVVQAQRLIALSPAVAGALVLFDDDGGHVQLAQARAQRDAALAAADDQHIWLGLVAQFGRFPLALFLPGLAVAAAAVLGALGPAHAAGLLVPLQFGHGGEQGPDFAVLDSDVAVAARKIGVDVEPALQEAVGVGHGLRVVPGKAHRLDMPQLLLQHVADLVAAFQGAQVPAEQHQVAPIAFVLEHLGDGVDVLVAQRGVQARKHRVQGGVGGVVGRHILSPCPWRAVVVVADVPVRRRPRPVPDGGRRLHTCNCRASRGCALKFPCPRDERSMTGIRRRGGCNTCGGWVLQRRGISAARTGRSAASGDEWWSGPRPAAGRFPRHCRRSWPGPIAAPLLRR